MLKTSVQFSDKFTGVLNLSIRFENGTPSLDSWEYKDATNALPASEHASGNVFQSRLLSVVHGIDRWTSAIDAFAQDLRALASPNHDAFFSSLQPKIGGRERMHLARRREDVYPRVDLARAHSIKLAEGWYLGTNISNREKLNFLEIACALKGLTPKPFKHSSGRI